MNIDPGRSDYVEFVVGRGIPDDALITAAAGAGFGTDMAPETATLAPKRSPRAWNRWSSAHLRTVPSRPAWAR